uniref:Enhancer of polycomb-like protein n=1 Tax=Vannella robusta TaxID=1487602 RepID=A0A7S4I1N0_9EUKA|mmetsp:Transcript_19165/g.24192  ORF Transcript_19165/g.24192 Transcript_19165/m.24192 type:complete len:413 (+) Transcript_19165:121-1359(+)
MTSFRPRPIDVDKPLFIMREELKDEDTRSMPVVSTGMEQHEENESHIRNAILEAQRKSTRIVADIPTPVVKTVPTYDRDTQQWDRPSSYIKVVPPIHPLFRDSVTYQIEYDLDSDDEQWMSNEINKNGMQLLSESDFELLIDTFEKALAREKILSANPKEKKDRLSLESAIEAVKELKQLYPTQLVETVYNYWLDKRSKAKRSLLLSLVPPPAFDDPSPLVPFRPREKETRKRSRRSNVSALAHLKLLRDEIERGKCLLEMIQKREEMKREKIEANQHLFEVVAANKQLQIDKLRAEGHPDKRSKTFCLGMVSDEDDDVDMEDAASAEEVEEEEQIEEESVEPHCKWDRFPPHFHNEENNPNDETYWGTVRLPGAPPFRGRMRMGRGGRVFIDRASSRSTQLSTQPQRLMIY